MKTHVVQTTPEVTLAAALDLMDLYQVSVLPVVDSDGRLLGILLERDIVGRILDCLNNGQGRHMSRAATCAAAAKSIVRDTMRTHAFTISETDDLADVARSVLEQDYERLPVVDGEQRVIGTVSRIDVCEALIEIGLVTDQPDVQSV